MILYDFRCTACERRYEALLAKGESPCCPSCGPVPCVRLVSAPKVHLPRYSVSRGRVEEPPPGAMDTRDIARKAGVDV